MSGEPVIPVVASQRDKEAVELLQIAHDVLVMAIKTMPNWKDSRFVVEDVQRVDNMIRDLKMLVR